jgi:hypothetical protein
MCRNYFEGANCAIVVAEARDWPNGPSFIQAQKWRQEIDQHLPNIPVFLILSKIDQHTLTTEQIIEIQRYIHHNGQRYEDWFQTSVKYNYGEGSITEALDIIVNYVSKLTPPPKLKNKGTFMINPNQENKNKEESSCCVSVSVDIRFK